MVDVERWIEIILEVQNPLEKVDADDALPSVLPVIRKRPLERQKLRRGG